MVKVEVFVFWFGEVDIMMSVVVIRPMAGDSLPPIFCPMIETKRQLSSRR